MQFRYESFGGIIASETPPFLAYISKLFCKILGYKKSDLWDKPSELLSAPTEIHFSLTNECNTNCQHCYMDSGEKDKDELSKEEVIKTIDILSEKKVFSMALGGGEVLLRKDLFEIAHYMRKKGIVPNITTNGKLLNAEMVKKCRVFGQVNLSIDSMTNTSFRTESNYQTSLTALALLQKEKIKTGINCVISRKNFHELESIYKFCKKKKISEIEFLRLKPAGRGKQHYLKWKLLPEQNILLYPLLKKLIKKYRIVTKIDCSMLPIICYHSPSLWKLKKLAAYGCEAGNVLLGVKSNGQVSPCSFAGATSLQIDTINDFWYTSDDLKQFRTWSTSAPEPCKSCKYLTICKGGCHPIARFETGDFQQGDPGCPIVHKYNLAK